LLICGVGSLVGAILLMNERRSVGGPPRT
jgi:hypothetical protein